MPDRQPEIKGNTASEQYRVTPKRNSVQFLCLPDLSGVTLALKKLQ